MTTSEFLRGSRDYPAIPAQYCDAAGMVFESCIRAFQNHEQNERAKAEILKRVALKTEKLDRLEDPIEKVVVYVKGKPVDITCEPVVSAIEKELHEIRNGTTINIPYRPKSALVCFTPLKKFLEKYTSYCPNQIAKLIQDLMPGDTSLDLIAKRLKIFRR